MVFSVGFVPVNKGNEKKSNVAQKHLIEIALIKKIWRVVDNGIAQRLERMQNIKKLLNSKEFW
jgi:hypothetical protein